MKSYDAHRNTTEARQGSRRLMNFRVLLFSVVAIVVAFALMLFLFYLMAQGTSVQ